MIKPKLALIPSAYKAGSPKGTLYSVLPSDGVGDFDFERAGEATRINKDGLIETVDSNVPRLNYPLIDGVVSGCPSLLLEPASTNLIQYSEDFTQGWTETNSTVTSNQVISPDGTQNADKLERSSTGGYIGFNVGLSGQHSYSVFAKKGNLNYVRLLSIGTGNPNVYFDLSNGTIGTETSANGYIDYYGNGWYKCTIVFDIAFTGLRIYATENDNDTGGVNGFVYIWGAQLEQSSFPTSYIPNYGTALGVTRSAETCNNAGDVNTFNDSEGVLMAEISALADGGTSRRISIRHTTVNIDNRVTIEVDETAGTIKSFMSSGGTTVGSLEVNGINQTHNNKVAVIYKANTFNIYVNGFLLDTDPSVASLPIGLSRLQFEGANGSNNFYGNIKQIQYFDKALTDEELALLTKI